MLAYVHNVCVIVSRQTSFCESITFFRSSVPFVYSQIYSPEAVTKCIS